jgi:hypothetical protein
VSNGPTLEDFTDGTDLFIEYLDKAPDKYDKRSFFLYWIGQGIHEGRVRGQIFHANTELHLKDHIWKEWKET